MTHTYGRTKVNSDLKIYLDLSQLSLSKTDYAFSMTCVKVRRGQPRLLTSTHATFFTNLYKEI